MSENQLHKTQISILHSLRYSSNERFSTLMKPTRHMSDTFKFHLQKLIKLGHIEKLASGEYSLTPSGKLYANALDEANGTAKKQPKLSVLVVAQKKEQGGTLKYLLFKRSRNPFMGYWAAITDVVRRGETFNDAARRVLYKHTGLHSDFDMASMARVRNFANESNVLLEDVTFAVMLAKNISGSLHNDYPGGKNAWLSIDELLTKEKHFESLPAILKSAGNRFAYIEQDLFHSLEDF
jgi:ADP-ribose pyrophosphatase YjhB (NUDIX family)